MNQRVSHFGLNTPNILMIILIGKRTSIACSRSKRKSETLHLLIEPQNHGHKNRLRRAGAGHRTGSIRIGAGIDEEVIKSGLFVRPKSRAEKPPAASLLFQLQPIGRYRASQECSPKASLHKPLKRTEFHVQKNPVRVTEVASFFHRGSE